MHIHDKVKTTLQGNELKTDANSGENEINLEKTKFQFDSTSSNKLICLPKLFVVIISTVKTNVVCFHMLRSH